MSQKYQEYKGLNLPNVAQTVLEKWNAENVFEKSISTRDEEKQFVFFEGPPSANGLPGIHHVMARSIKDIFCRYKTLQGFQVKRKAGWDTHGLPIELGVEKELGITKEDIGNKISVEDYNKACKETVMRYTDIWNDFVAVFVKDENNNAKHTSRIQNASMPFTNGRLYNSENIANYVEPSQDQVGHQKLIEIVSALNKILSK